MVLCWVPCLSMHCRFSLPDHLQLVNLKPLADRRAAQQTPAEQELLNVRESSHGSGLFTLFAKEVDDSLTWEAIPWLRTITKLPIYVKVSGWRTELV